MEDGPISIHVENFKSLHDFRMECRKFNVLIGVNGSGKTNVLEVFKFANLCIDPDRTPPYPFLPWSGFRNVVWSCDPALPILFEVQYGVGEYIFNYKMEIDGSSGRLEFTDEELSISNYIVIHRSFQDVEYNLDRTFLEQVRTVSALDAYLKRMAGRIPDEPWTEKIPDSTSILRRIADARVRRHPTLRRRTNQEKNAPSSTSSSRLSLDQIGFIHTYSESDDSIRMIPTVTVKNNSKRQFVHEHTSNLFSNPHSVILLRHLNYASLRDSPQVGHSTELKEDGSGLVNLLFKWNSEGSGLPDRFELALEALFPNWQVSLALAENGRILLKVNDGNTYLSPSSIPDGFYKLLAILAAIELRPKFLLIDEVETSLHAEIVEYVIAELSTCDLRVIVTSHSPLLIDAVKLEDIVILERTESGTVGKKIKDPERMRQELHEKKITLSESWIYGSL